jgi:hypothetical protein
MPLNIGFNRFEAGIFYRTLNMKASGDGNSLLNYVVNKGTERIDLADIVIPGGWIRVDRVRIPLENELRLGHYALPHRDGIPAVIGRSAADGCKVMTASIRGSRIAMTAVWGWDGLEAELHAGKSAETAESTLIYAHRADRKNYAGMEVLITVMLSRHDDRDWTEDELMPIRSFEILPWAPSGQPLGIRLELKNGGRYLVDFGNVEGNLK